MLCFGCFVFVCVRFSCKDAMLFPFTPAELRMTAMQRVQLHTRNELLGLRLDVLLILIGTRKDHAYGDIFHDRSRIVEQRVPVALLCFLVAHDVRDRHRNHAHGKVHKEGRNAANERKPCISGECRGHTEHVGDVGEFVRRALSQEGVHGIMRATECILRLNAYASIHVNEDAQHHQEHHEHFNGDHEGVARLEL